MSNLKAYVIANESNVKRYNTFTLLRALERRGVTADLIDRSNIRLPPDLSYSPDTIDIDLDPDLDFVYEGVIKTFEKRDICLFADPIYLMPESNNLFRILLIEKLRNISTTFVNNLDSHLNAANKIKMHEALKNKNIPTLRTKILYEDNDEYISNKVSEVGGYPVIVKDPISSLGRGVHRCNNLGELKTARSRIAESNGSSLVVLQELHDISGVILCARVVGDKVWPRFTLGSPYREDGFMGNISAGRAYFAHNYNDELYELCVNATKSLEMDTSRIDVFITDDGYKVCEVNSIGSILGGDIAHGVDIGDEIVDLAIRKHEARDV